MPDKFIPDQIIQKTSYALIQRHSIGFQDYFRILRFFMGFEHRYPYAATNMIAHFRITATIISRECLEDGINWTPTLLLLTLARIIVQLLI